MTVRVFSSFDRQLLHRVRRVLCLVGAFVLLCVPAVFINNVMGYVAAFAFIAAVVLSRLWHSVVRRSVHVGLSDSNTHVVRGDDIELAVAVENLGVLYAPFLKLVFGELDAQGNERMLATEELSLLPHQKRELLYRLSCVHVGTFTITARKAQASDPLRIFSAELAAEFSCDVFVEPRLFDLHLLDIELSEDLECDEMLTSRRDEGMDYTGVRDYELGDPLKSIHWKLSARFSDMLTRLFAQSCMPGMLVLCDFSCEQDDAEAMAYMYDALVESMFSFERFACQRNYEVTLAFSDGHSSCRIDARSGENYLELMAKMPLLGDVEACEQAMYIESECLRSRGCSNVVVITANPNARLAQVLSSLKEHGRVVILVVACPPDVQGSARRAYLGPLDMLAASHIPVFCVSDTQEFAQGSYYEL